jgi:hypothetical protein
LILTVYNTADTLEVPFCNNALPYYYYRPSDNWRFEFYTAGVYPVDTITGGLCDSIFYVNLAVIDNPLWHEYATLCQTETLNFRNNIIYGKDYPLGMNTLHFEVPSIYDCDTLMTLFLTVVRADSITIKDEICVGEPYYINGFGLEEQNTAGTFYFTHDPPLQNQYGCDSIVTLELTVHPHKDTTIYDTICAGETYSGYGFIVNETEPGEYQYIDSVTNGRCKYTFTLNLTVLPNLKMDTLPLMDDICGNLPNFTVKYSVFAGKIDTIFVSFDEKAQEAGFTDIVDYNPSIDHIKIDLPIDIRPDNYSVTLHFYGRCGDTTFTVHFTVLYPSSIMEQRWNDVIILKNPAYNGGYDFSYIEWFVDGMPVNPLFDKGSYIYTENSALQFGSKYRVRLTRLFETQQFCSCPLIPIQHYGASEFPRIVSGCCGKIKVYSDEPIVELWLINMLGQTVKTGHYANTEIEINANAGIYILRLATDKGQIYNQKVIVQ